MNSAMNGQASGNAGRRVFITIGIIGGLILLGATVMFSRIVMDRIESKQVRTRVIMNVIKAEIQMEMANKGKVPATFDQWYEALRSSNSLKELQDLKAIDRERRCFVDAWGNPISITFGENNNIVLLSSGNDGILGNKDDVR